MAVSLSKGGNVSLTKEAPGLTEVLTASVSFVNGHGKRDPVDVGGLVLEFTQYKYAGRRG